MKGIQSFALIVLSFLVILLLPAIPAWLAAAAIFIGLWKWWIWQLLCFAALPFGDARLAFTFTPLFFSNNPHILQPHAPSFTS
ncbi:MAG: hypothetical protein NTX25_18415 [Proteobacteria bacterium]|nr:hypothetical protein [Pseudomonadota bacterium]